LSDPLRIAFVSGHSRWLRKQRLVAKYLKMRLEGLVYPDVYCLALMLLSLIRERTYLSDIPSLARGTALTLVLAAILSMTFMGFAGMGSGG